MKPDTPIDSPRSPPSRSISILFFISRDKQPQLREQENSLGDNYRTRETPIVVYSTREIHFELLAVVDRKKEISLTFAREKVTLSIFKMPNGVIVVCETLTFLHYHCEINSPRPYKINRIVTEKKLKHF